eukprot:SAG31_NODE_2977_length_4833_cov_5.035488_3_plen_206_part_00
MSDVVDRLCGIVASKLLEGSRLNGADGGAAGTPVVLTDGSEEAIAMCRDNIATNGCGRTCTCEQLHWGRGPALESLSSRFAAGFDLILRADVVYDKIEKGQLNALMETISRLLRRPGAGSPPTIGWAAIRRAVFLLAFCRRQDPVETVLNLATEQCGLMSTLMPDRVYDMFGDNADGMTDMLSDCIYQFRWARGKTESKGDYEDD